MISPDILKKGDTISLTAPARFITEAEINDFTVLAKSWGLKLKIPAGLYARYHQFAGNDSTRGKCLQEVMDDAEIKAIFCARGGYGSLRILEQINIRNYTRFPKWIIGFSDITAIHAWLNHQGFESVHALMPFSYRTSDKDSVLSAASLREMLFTGPPDYQFAGHPMNTTGNAEGELIGGNLSVIYSLQATPWQYHPGNRILFIEDVDEYLYHLDRMMTNLRLSGFLCRLKGIIVGYMSEMHDNKIPFGKDAFKIIADAVKPFGYPVCYGFPAGHKEPNYALIFGRKVRLEAGKNLCRLQFAATDE
jgi:muramoyltetrapeptide carboxypeptidase